VLARDAWSRATQAFARAAALEPAFAVRLESLARQAIHERAPEKAEIVREALRRAAQEGRGSRLPRLVLALGRVQRETGDSGALASFQSYLDSGDDRALGMVELGRTRLLLGDRAGAAMYLQAAQEDDPIATAEIRADLQPIATDAELATFDLRRGQARAELVRRFWGNRDRLELREEGDRLAEHFRRLAIARRDFLFTNTDGIEQMDDRGRVFIRHGEPDDRVSFTQAGVEPNESWHYRRGGRDIILHFAARQTPGDYRLVESVLDVSDARGYIAAGSASRSAPVTSSGSEQLIRSRAALNSIYQQLPGGRPAQVADFLARERELGREGIRVGTLSDSYTLRFPLELNAWGSVVVAGGSGAEPALQVLFAIPGYAIEPATGTAGVVYPVRVRFVALDSIGAVAASIDTVLRLEPGDRIAANRTLTGRVAVPVRPGRLIAQAAVQYGDRAGSAFGVDSLVVPSPGGDVLALGDLLIGSERGRLSVPLGDGQMIPLAPGGVASRSGSAELAVEVFGLGAGGTATLHVYAAPLRDVEGEPGGPDRWRPFPGMPNDIRVTRGLGQGPIVRSRVALPLRKLKPGSWSVAVVVTDGAGRTARREGQLTVLVP
jgi:GWxTD domain-containing protein